ncbi:MAG: hypothetical protein K6E28_03285 [Eubacterium sp.]|nr:hypothetical protein [Eubacterium sp.]
MKNREEGKSKFSTALLKAKMTIEAKRQDRKDNRDKLIILNYLKQQLNTARDSVRKRSKR